MTRPEHVRCANCCYWTRMPGDGNTEGFCRRLPPQYQDRQQSFDRAPTLEGDWWCGEFSAEWPDDEGEIIMAHYDKPE